MEHGFAANDHAAEDSIDLTFADLSDVEVDPADGELGVLDLLVRH